MKRKRIRFNRIPMLLAVVCMLTGCGCSMSEENETHRYETESFFYNPTEKESRNEEESFKDGDTNPVRIALIDTGISTLAIDKNVVGEGWNYVKNNDDTKDKIGHGTAVASIIVGSEKAGLKGICKKEIIFIPLVYCTLDEENNTKQVSIETMAQMIYDAIDKYHCTIIQFSSGTKKDYEVLRQAVEYAASKGIIFVSSAGNEGTEEVYYPGGYESVICVGSFSEDLKTPADFSQKNSTVDVYAPGVEIPAATLKGNIIRVTGTSYSAAYITAELINQKVP